MRFERGIKRIFHGYDIPAEQYGKEESRYDSLGGEYTVIIPCEPDEDGAFLILDGSEDETVELVNGKCVCDYCTGKVPCENYFEGFGASEVMMWDIPELIDSEIYKLNNLMHEKAGTLVEKLATIYGQLVDFSIPSVSEILKSDGRLLQGRILYDTNQLTVSYPIRLNFSGTAIEIWNHFVISIDELTA